MSFFFEKYEYIKKFYGGSQSAAKKILLGYLEKNKKKMYCKKLV
jgi:hypothetical protein